jgi:hypothetical protein
MTSSVQFYRHSSLLKALSVFLFIAGVFQCISVPAYAQACAPDTIAVPASTQEYTVQKDEWNSNATECLTVDASLINFTVAQSSLSDTTTLDRNSDHPSAYPSIYKGCHWNANNCTPNSGMPLLVSSIASVTSSWTPQLSQSSTDKFDVAYDIWFDREQPISSQPDGAELMIWLNSQGGPHPVGQRADNGVPVNIGGATFEVWFGTSGWNVISYVLTGSGSPAISQAGTTNLDIWPFISDAMGRGYIQSTWSLISIEAGFEIWDGGQGLQTKSFSASVAPGTNPPGSNPPPPLSSAALSVWWPTDGSVLSGTQPFKARLDNVALSSYQMYWSVDGGQQNPMSDNTSEGDHKEAAVDLSDWTWRDAGANWGPFAVNFTAKDMSGNTVQQKVVNIYVTKSLSSSTLSVWWPTNNAVLSGVQPFKARLDNLTLSSYKMYWSVDGGQLNLMSDNTTGGDHKEASVDLSGWTWRDAGTNWGPFSVTFVVQDLSGSTIKTQTTTTYVSKTTPTVSLSIWWPTGGSVVSGTQPFKARLENMTLPAYQMYWSVDGGQLNLMTDNTVGGDHKEASVDLSGWTWRDAGTSWGPFSVNFIGKDTSGNMIQQKAITIYVSK